MAGGILVFNAGSSTVKSSLFTPELTLAFRAVFELGRSPSLRISGNEGATIHEQRYDTLDYGRCLDEWLMWLHKQGAGQIAAAGHRVVHGGMAFAAPVMIDDTVLEKLERLVPLAPLHQPHNLSAVRALHQKLPSLPQVACFDTAFHATQPAINRRYALPRELEAEGVRRYGFHGISYETIAQRLKAVDAAAASGRIIVAHLGSGASLCAMHDGKSVDTTMGFSALDGLVMGTRCGALDPEIVLYMQRERHMTPAQVEELLYKRSGLLGVSGISADMRELESSASPQARDAIELFTFRIVREAGALTATLGGLDGLVFTAGIGEHSPLIRQKVCQGLSWLGLTIDETANRRAETAIHSASSRVKAWVIPTDEEAAIARHTRALMA